MPRKQRDYKTEYARSKARAKTAGYRSEREYKRVKRALSLPARSSPISKRVLEREPDERRALKPESKLRREAREWAKKHSRQDNSKYSIRMTDEQVAAYHHAYVEPLPDGLSRRGKAKEKQFRIHDYLVPEWISEDQWKQTYKHSK